MTRGRLFYELLFLAGLAALFLFLFWRDLFPFVPSSILDNTQQNQVCFKKTCFTVELADNALERARGLMFRETLPENQGMLFIFDQEGKHSFWMKNTLIPLDIIWLDQARNVVFIGQNVPPCDAPQCPGINPQKSAKYVLEINGGLCDKINLRPGDRLVFRLSSDQ